MAKPSPKPGSRKKNPKKPPNSTQKHKPLTIDCENRCVKSLGIYVRKNWAEMDGWGKKNILRKNVDPYHFVKK